MYMYLYFHFYSSNIAALCLILAEDHCIIVLVKPTDIPNIAGEG